MAISSMDLQKAKKYRKPMSLKAKVFWGNRAIIFLFGAIFGIVLGIVTYTYGLIDKGLL